MLYSLAFRNYFQIYSMAIYRKAMAIGVPLKEKREIPYKEGNLKSIGAHVGYTVLYWGMGI